ncbi:hypothetical protein [Ensifer adhaerens]|uniref:hypothetical protein n=1 Tax=Ensifer adhaerens TaxID=106592 RepID=UPI00098FACCC|nr:hypothetical protein [Ensifer adhaerens]
MMDGLMLRRCDEIARQVNLADCRASVQLASGLVELYLGASEDRLTQLGLMNVIIRARDERIFGIDVDAIKNTRIVVKNQENMQEPNTSAVTAIWLEEGGIFAQHWDGFTSIFDVNTMELISQSYTK